MTLQFAGRDGNQSGQRFLDGSDPRLGRHVAPCEAAGGDSHSLPAGKDEKPSREFEGGALICAEGAVPSLLDSIKNNRHKEAPDYYARPVGRGKFCGRWSIRGKDSERNSVVTRRLNCGAWTCSYCGPRKAKRARYAIRSVAEKLGLNHFLTLTLDPSKLTDTEDPVHHLRNVFNKFREYLRRRFGSPTFICVLEFTQRGIPHLHILLDRYIEHAWISKTWDRLGGGYIVRINKVNVRNVARYLSKYLTKELILSAPKGARRITTSRSIKLFPKFDSGISWDVLKESIWHLLSAQRATEFGCQEDLFRFTVLQFDEEEFLKAFEVVGDD